MKKLTTCKLCILIFVQLILVQVSASDSNGLAQLKEQLENTTNIKEKAELYLNISNQFAHTDIKLSIKYAEEGLQFVTKNQDKKNLARLSALLGRLYLEDGRKEKALEKIEAAIKTAKKEKLKEIEANTTISLGYYWYRLGDSTKTISNYEKGFDLFRKLKDNNGIAKSYLKLGWGYDIYGNYEAAEKAFQNAIAMEDQITDTTLLINVLSGMGAFYINKSIKQQKAIQYFERALELSLSKGESYNVGRTYNALGLLYESLSNKETAKSFYLKGLEIFEKQNNKAEICWLYISIGGLLSDEKKFDEALEYFEKALKIANDIGFLSPLQMAEIHLSIGLVHRERGDDYLEALKYFDKSLELAKSIKNSYQTMNTELAIGVCHVAMNNFTEGQKWCEKAFDKGQNHLLLSQEACDCLFKASQGLGDYKLALYYHKEYKTRTDSLHREELSEEINNLAAKQDYELELAEIQKTQEVTAANLRIKSIKTISIISFFALLIIMSLLLAFVRKNEQKKQLQALSLVRKEMIANVSHDLRTPITVMIGYLETLLMRLGKTNVVDQEKYLNIILNSAERLSQLIGQLFEFSKLEAQQIEPIKESFQLADLVKTSLTKYEILADKKKVQLKINCDEDIPLVYADAILIERVIQNLMDNALKFTPEQGVISVDLSNKKDQVQVKISDTGKGISKEKEKLIFERYEKSQTSEGAGLGLTIVKNILDIHGSSIQVKSKLNQGTSFIFSLPSQEENFVKDAG